MKAKENKRMGTIARRINRSQLTTMAMSLVVVDVLILLSLLLGWAYNAEQLALGNSWQPMMRRSLEWLEGSRGLKLLDSLHYVFSLDGEALHRVAAGGFLRLVRNIGLVVLMGQTLLLVLSWRGGRRRTMRLLHPLSQMSDQAEQLSQIRFDEQKYHDLEDAISAISPSAPEARLATGNSELLGLENAVNSLLSRMHESYRQQVRFVSDASHELRTPIQVIRGYAEMLDRWGKRDPKVLSESIDAIRSETDNMQQLVEQLLFLARGDAGRNQPSMEALDLSQLMRELHEEYGMIDQDHHWHLVADQPVPAYGDPALLKQAARILCDNAAKYSGQGQTITLRSGLDDKQTPFFSVQDSGNGIAAEDIPHIFERFYRADPARARQTGGSGLGLSIAKWIVDRHQGYLQVVSREGLGTRMSVHLPAKEVRPRQEQPAAEGVSG